MNNIQKRSWSYTLLGVALIISYFIFHDSAWGGSQQLHTLSESLAALLGLIIGFLSLTRYYSREDNAFLILGAGFLGLGFINGFHGMATSVWFKDAFQSDYYSLLLWSLLSSQLLLAGVFFFSCFIWCRQQTPGKVIHLNPHILYFSITAFITFYCLFFILIPLPNLATSQTPIIYQPQKIVPILLYALVLKSYLQKGRWHDNVLQYFLILAVILYLGHCFYLAFSKEPFDAAFQLATLLKITSYSLVLAGLILNIFQLFKVKEHEIEEKTQAQNKLANSEARFRSVIDTVLEGILTIDSKGIVDTMNPAAEQIFGYAAAEVIGQNIKMLMPEPYHSEHDGYLEHYKKTGQAKIIGIGREVSGRRKDGSVFPMELAVSEMQIDGKPMFTGLVRDISDRKAAQMALINNEIRFSSVVNTVVEGIITIDKKGIVETMNPAAEHIFGFKASEVIGQNIKMLMPEPYHSEHDGYLENYLTTHQAKIIGIGREVKGRRMDGSIFPMELAVSEMELEGKKMFTGLVRDITERKKIDRMKNEFISTVSHELRTPLTSIQGSLALLLGGASGKISEQSKKLLSIANSNSERLVRLINDILDIEKIESGHMIFNLKPVEIMPVIHQAIDELEEYLAQLGVKIVITKDLPKHFVVADTDRVIQVITNLLSNAAKYSPQNGQIDLTVTLNNNFIRVTITDFGPGIPESFRDRIFSKFSQADSSDARQKGGTGLGLNICKAIVKKMGGQIDFVSELNKKTSFFFDLPVWQNITTDSNLKAPLNKTILICEDDPEVADLLKILLENKGYATKIAYSAEEAWQLLQAKIYDAVTLDIKLPGRNGIDLFKEMKEHEKTREIPIIVISVIAEQAKNELNGEALSVIDWLSKPLDVTRLEKAVTKALQQNNNIPRILHIEDDPDTIDFVNSMLKDIAEINVATDIQTAQKMLKQDYDLAILDITLPDGSGASLLPLLTLREHPIPVVIFSANENRIISKDVAANLVKSKKGSELLVNSIVSILQQKDG